MNKRELIAFIAETAGISRTDAACALESFVGAITSALAAPEGTIRAPGLGTFRIVQLRERQGVNPRTGERIRVPATKRPRFSASRSLRLAVLGKAD